MKYIFISSLICINYFAVAQRSDKQIIEDSIIGWEKVFNFKGKQYKPTLIEGRTYSPKQLAICDSFISWMQRSYIPIAGLGVAYPAITPKKDVYLPMGYGAKFDIYTPQFDATRKKLVKIGTSWDPIRITANHVPDSEPISFLNSDNQYIFTRQPDGWMYPYFTELNKKLDQRIHPNVYKYLTIHKAHNGIGFIEAVYLIPGNKLPYTQLTRAEFLNLVEIGLEKYYKGKREIAIKENADPKFRAEALKYVEEDRSIRIAALTKIREKYKASLTEKAFLYDNQFDPYSLREDRDIFQNNSSRSDNLLYPVFKIEPEVYARCKSDQPQWICIEWVSDTKEGRRKTYEKHRAVVENFNFDYVYNYFFDPEKVKGIVYRPANEDLLKATLEKYKKKEYIKAPDIILPPGIHFMDDFSTNTVGNAASGWYAGGGGNSVVTTLNEFSGKWLQLGTSNTITPSTSLKLPLPENFTLEFEVATSDFKGRTGGNITLILEDKKNGTEIKFNLTPANDQYLGSYASSANLSIQLPRNIKYDAIRTEMELTDFSSKKRKAHITIKKTGRQLLVFINGKQMPYLDVYKKDKSQEMLLAPGTLFNSIIWRNQTSDPEAKAYLSNIKITKN